MPNPFYDTETGKPKYLGQNGELPTGTSPLIYLPLRGDDAGANKGTGGDFMVNSGPFTGARGPSEFWGESAEFNGTNQKLTRASDLAGNADGKAFAIVFSVYQDSTNAGNIYQSGVGSSAGFNLYVNNTSGNWQFVCRNAANTIILDAQIAATTLIQNAWNNILLSVDLADPANRFLVIDGVDQTAAVTWSTYTNDTINFTNADHNIGAEGTASLFDGKIGFLWFDTTYIDFSQEANRLKFFDAFGYPVDLGADGSKPTGTTPLIYMNKGFHLGTNLGSGGNFTPINGPTDGGFVKG